MFEIWVSFICLLQPIKLNSHVCILHIPGIKKYHKNKQSCTDLFHQHTAFTYLLEPTTTTIPPVQRTWKEFLPSLDQGRIDSHQARESERERERESNKIDTKKSSQGGYIDMWTLTGLMFSYLLWSVIPPLQRIQDFSGGKTRILRENGSRQRGINNTGMLTIAVATSAVSIRCILGRRSAEYCKRRWWVKLELRVHTETCSSKLLLVYLPFLHAMVEELLLLCSPEKILHVAMVLAALMIRHRCFAKTLDIFFSPSVSLLTIQKHPK